MVGKQLSLVLFLSQTSGVGSTDFLGKMDEEEESCDPAIRVPCRALPGLPMATKPAAYLGSCTTRPGEHKSGRGHDKSTLPGNTQRPKNQNTNSHGPFQTKLLFF